MLLSIISGSFFGLIVSFIAVNMYKYATSFKGKKNYDTVAITAIMSISILGPFFIYLEQCAVSLWSLDENASGFSFAILAVLNFIIYGMRRGIFKNNRK